MGNIKEIVKEFDKELLEILAGSFGISINLSDFFYYATADMILIDYKDLVWILPIYKKYGWEGIYASASHIAKLTPIKEAITPEFERALKEIQLLDPKIYSEY